MLLYYAIVGVSGFILAALLIALRKTFFDMIEAALSLSNEVLSDEDEITKQSNLIGALKKMMVSLGKVLITVIIIAASTALPIYLYSLLKGVNYEDLDLGSIWFILSLSVGSILPFVFKKKNKVENYSEASILLHKLILNNYYLSKFLFSFDRRFKSGEKVNDNDLFLIVSGLARAGTTSLTDQLFKTGKFSSLDYSNMPLLLAPNLWRRLYNPKKAKLKERKHGDKMMFGLNTIEALEEYFFKAFLNDTYIDEKTLSKHDIDSDVYENYINYQSLIRKDNSHLYLSKNNNLILRYSSLRALNKKFKAVFLFRKPEEHAFSLLNQHLRFSKFQNDDDFIETYMNWLGHHEFGGNHKVFRFEEQPLQIEYDINTLDYWLAVWLNYYTYLCSMDDSNFLLIEYSDYLENPKDVLNHLGKEMNMELDLTNIEPFNNSRTIDTSNCNRELLKATDTIYQDLKHRKVSFT